jgi:hypothetical protein
MAHKMAAALGGRFNAVANGESAAADVWIPADEEDTSGDGIRPLLFRTMKVKGSILHPYR